MCTNLLVDVMKTETGIYIHERSESLVNAVCDYLYSAPPFSCNRLIHSETDNAKPSIL